MLNAENLTVRYGAYTAVSRLSFTLEEGQWLMLVGPNGAGKSSLISAIAQCVPYEGTIRLEGKNLRDFRPAELARKIGVLSQQHTVSYGYTVEYYYDGVKDASKTENLSATFGDVIESYDAKLIDGYKFDHDTGKPLTITSNAANNVISEY